MKKLFYALTAIVLLHVSGTTQNQHLLDSLQTRLKFLEDERTELRNGVASLRDSSIANILHKLCVLHVHSNPDKAMDYGSQCLILSEQIGYEKGMSRAHVCIGNIYVDKGNYPEGLKNQLAALKINEQAKPVTARHKGVIAGCHHNIGGIYKLQANYPEALKHYFAAVKINEELGDKKWVILNCKKIGEVYLLQDKKTEALDIFSSALKTAVEMGDKKQIAEIHILIGNVYSAQGNYPEALKKYLLALKINEETGNKTSAARCYREMAFDYKTQHNYPEALKNFFAELTILEELGDMYSVVECYCNIGITYNDSHRPKEAQTWLQKSMELSKTIGSMEHIAFIYKELAFADSAMGNYKGAFENHKMHIQYKDSIRNEANIKKITQQQMQYEFDKKEALVKAEQEKKDAVAREEIEKQKLVRNGFIGGFATVLLFAGTFFRQRNRIHNEKKRSDQLLRNILPDEVAEELKETGSTKAKTHEMVSVMFTDFKDFTKISETVSAESLVGELHTCFSAFDTILHKYNIEKIKTIGDAYMCVSGLPIPNANHASDMVTAAIEIMAYVNARKKEKDARGEFSFELRIGINSGPVVAGIVGLKKFSYDIWGDTVNTAARMEHQGEAGKINISGTTYELVKDKFACTHRGKITAKNKGEIDMYFINEPNNV